MKDYQVFFLAAPLWAMAEFYSTAIVCVFIGVIGHIYASLKGKHE